jgi:hypothetical protein
VNYVAVGAIALSAHRVVRATTDVDVIPIPLPTIWPAWRAAITSLGGSPHGGPQTPVTAELLGRNATCASKQPPAR